MLRMQIPSIHLQLLRFTVHHGMDANMDAQTELIRSRGRRRRGRWRGRGRVRVGGARFEETAAQTARSVFVWQR